MRLRTSVLHYTERSEGKYRDLRSVELTARGRAYRISLNGQYRSGKRQYDATRYANPGWSFGTERVLINWTHFGRFFWHRRYYHGPIHLSFEAFERGITFSTHSNRY